MSWKTGQMHKRPRERAEGQNGRTTRGTHLLASKWVPRVNSSGRNVASRTRNGQRELILSLPGANVPFFVNSFESLFHAIYSQENLGGLNMISIRLHTENILDSSPVAT
jgi:hypothetical protein